MISERYGMTEAEFNQAMSYDWRDLRIETLERELVRQKQEHEKDLILLKEDAEYWFQQYKQFKDKYLSALDYKIFS